MLTKQSRTTYKEWCSSLVVGRTTNNSSNRKPECYEMLHMALVFASSCEQGNEPSGAITGREFFD
jgi:hypothetical protein